MNQDQLMQMMQMPSPQPDVTVPMFMEYAKKAVATKSPAHAGCDEKIFDIGHAAMGVLDEHIELTDAFMNQDLAGIIEEFGDMLWFTALAFNAVDGYQWTTEELVDRELLVTPTSFGTMLKKRFAYNKESITDLQIAQACVAISTNLLRPQYNNLKNVLESMIPTFKTNGEFVLKPLESYPEALQRLLDSNITKLQSKSFGRYTEGDFTSKEENERKADVNRNVPFTQFLWPEFKDKANCFELVQLDVGVPQDCEYIYQEVPSEDGQDKVEKSSFIVYKK